MPKSLPLGNKNYNPSAGRREPGSWITRQTGKIRQTDKKKLSGSLQPGGYSQMYLNVFPMTLATVGSGRREGYPLPYRGSPHLGKPREKGEHSS
jgi:hypothetical protein